MKKLLMAATAAGVVYVLGTKSGRARYEKMKAKASKLGHDPRVKQAVSEAADRMADTASAIADQVSDLAGQAARAAGSHAAH